MCLCMSTRGWVSVYRARGQWSIYLGRSEREARRARHIKHSWSDRKMCAGTERKLKCGLGKRNECVSYFFILSSLCGPRKTVIILKTF